MGGAGLWVGALWAWQHRASQSSTLLRATWQGPSWARPGASASTVFQRQKQTLRRSGPLLTRDGTSISQAARARHWGRRQLFPKSHLFSLVHVSRQLRCSTPATPCSRLPSSLLWEACKPLPSMSTHPVSAPRISDSHCGWSEPSIFLNQCFKVEVSYAYKNVNHEYTTR